MNWQPVVLKTWQQRGVLARCLWPLSLLSRAVVAKTRRDARLQAPVRQPIAMVVVGNVIAGGAGKTPTTLALAQDLIDRGERPVIVSKGHGRQAGSNAHFVVTPRTPARQAGDEPLLMAQQGICPVVVTDARADAVDWIRAKLPETSVLLFDDGLQDTALAADVELLLFDARGVGNGWLLPAGPLREPWPRRRWRPACKTLHLLSIAAHESPPDLGDLNGPLWLVTRQLQVIASRMDGTVSATLAQLAKQRCQALAGIAKPEQFFTMLAAAGFDLAQTHAMADHASLDQAYRRLSPSWPLLVTAKDAVKLQGWPEEWLARTWVLQLDFSLPPGLCQSVADAVAERRAALSSRHGQNTA